MFIGCDKNTLTADGAVVAYPEPIPVLKQKDAREFLKRLGQFKLTKEQAEFYKDAQEEYLKSVSKR
jgi:hypothetical protein